MGGASFDVQNEIASVGGQFKFSGFLNENSRNFQLGQRYEASGWAAYNAPTFVFGSVGYFAVPTDRDIKAFIAADSLAVAPIPKG